MMDATAVRTGGPVPDVDDHDGGAVDPGQARSWAEFAAGLKALGADESAHVIAGRSTRRPGIKISHGTVDNLRYGKRVPKWSSVEGFLGAVRRRVPSDEVARWRAAWQRLSGEAPEEGVASEDVLDRWSLGAVEDVNPFELGVHPAIEALEDDRRRGDRAGPRDTLPTYVPRDLDKPLRSAVRRARARGGMIVLVGDSCKGKSRAVLEALREEAPGCRVLMPSEPADLDDMGSALPRSDTVLLLDHAERFLTGSAPMTMSMMRRLISQRDPMIIVGTMWPREFNRLVTGDPYDSAARLPSTLAGTGVNDDDRVEHDSPRRDSSGRLKFDFGKAERDPYRVARQILEAYAEVVFVEAFNEVEVLRAEALATVDPRIRLALMDRDYTLPQFLAGAPYLENRWLHGDDTLMGRAVEAVITAAIDLTRIGVAEPIAPDLLEAAGLALLSERDRAFVQPGWFQEAISHASALIREATAALSPVRGEDATSIVGYRLADYLRQLGHAARDADPVVAGVWRAVADRLDPLMLRPVAASAYARLHVRLAEDFYRRALRAGDASASAGLGRIYLTQGRSDEAAEWLRQATAAGDMDAGRRLGHLLGDAARPVEAAWSAATDRQLRARDRQAVARFLEDVGEADKALQILTSLADEGHVTALYDIARIHRAARRPDEAIRAYRRAISLGDIQAHRLLADLLQAEGRTDEARKELETSVAEGDPLGYRRLVEAFARERKFDKAAQVCLAAREQARPGAYVAYCKLLMQFGRVDEALRELRSGVISGAIPVGHMYFARTWFRAADELARALREVVAADVPMARWHLAKVLEAAGRVDESLQVRREAVHAAEPRALRDLGDALLLWHYDREATEVFQRAVDLGDSSAYGPLVRRLITERRYPEAIELWLLAIEKGFRYGRRQLGDLYKILGRVAEAERQYADGAAAGDVECRERLIELLRSRGRSQQVDELVRRGIDPPETPAQGIRMAGRDVGRRRRGWTR